MQLQDFSSENALSISGLLNNSLAWQFYDPCIDPYKDLVSLQEIINRYHVSEIRKLFSQLASIRQFKAKRRAVLLYNQLGSNSIIDFETNKKLSKCHARQGLVQKTTTLLLNDFRRNIIKK